MTVTNLYADVEQMLVGWIPTVVAARAVTETPENLADVLPVVRVVRIGGASLQGFDQPTVDTDCFAATRPAAKALAIQLSTAYEYQLLGFFNTHGAVLNVDTVSGPSWRPWDVAGTTGLRRFGMTHRFTIHAH